MEAPVVGGSSVYDMAHEAVRSEGQIMGRFSCFAVNNGIFAALNRRSRFISWLFRYGVLNGCHFLA